jgi:hypothetical protein
MVAALHPFRPSFARVSRPAGYQTLFSEAPPLFGALVGPPCEHRGSGRFASRTRRAACRHEAAALNDLLA